MAEPGNNQGNLARNTFVGRERELTELRAALAEAEGGRGHLILISGEPGIGKTRLAAELAVEATARGIRVAWGRCWEGGGAPAYWPWVELVRSLVPEGNRAKAQQIVIPSEIGQLIPELSPETVQQRPSNDPEQARFRLFDAVATLLKQLARSSPLVLILDDLHEADRSSLDLFKFVARGLADSRIVIIGTYRDAEVRRSKDLAEAIAEILRHGNPMPLAGLDKSEVSQMIERHAERLPSASFASELHRVTAGNPLFVDGVVRVLVAERKLATAEHLDLSRFELPEGVRGAIRKRLAMLSANARSTLSVAAVIGQEFDAVLLQRVGELEAGSLVQLIREASDVGIVTTASRGNYRFTHPLIREALYKDSTDAERARLHLSVGEALEQMHAANLVPHLAALAHHFREAGVGTDPGKAIKYSIRAGDEARLVFANEEALSHWSAALKLVEEFGGERRDYAGLHHRLGALVGGIGQHAKSIEHLEKALRAYEELGDTRLAAEIHVTLGNHLSVRGLARGQDVPRAADHLRQAEAFFSRGPEDFRLAEVNFYIGQVALRSLRVRDAVAAYRNATEIAERVGDVNVWGLSTGRLASALPLTGNLGEALDVLARVWSRLDDINLPGHAFGAVWSAGGCFIQLWDPREAQRWWATELAKPRLASGQRKVFMRILQSAYLLSGDLPSTRKLLTQAPYPYGAGMLAFYEGEWEQADLILEQGLERARSGTPDQMLLYWQALARVRRIRSESVRAETLLQEALALYADEEPHCQVEMVVRPELALVHVEMGALEDAVAQVSRCREVSAGEDWRGLEGHLARAEAVVRAAQGNYEYAERQFGKAVATFQRYVLPWEQAETLFYWGRALNAAGDSRANEKFDAAIEIYRRFGAGQRWIDRAEGEKQAGPRRSAAITKNDTSNSIFRREGEYWTISYRGSTFRLKDAKGLRYLAYLLAHPGHRIHVYDLIEAVEGSARGGRTATHAHSEDLEIVRDIGGAVPMIDARARSEYGVRLRDLHAELDEAERMNDLGRSERLRTELEMVGEELSGSSGLGGRARTAAGSAERARGLVGRNIRSVVEKIRHEHPTLGRHFAATIRTGYFCAYQVEPDHSSWQL